MIFYIDDEFHCYSEAAEGLREVESDFFDGREELLPAYYFVPDGEVRTREDGLQFTGEMVIPV